MNISNVVIEDAAIGHGLLARGSKKDEQGSRHRKHLPKGKGRSTKVAVARTLAKFKFRVPTPKALYLYFQLCHIPIYPSWY